MKLYIGNKNSSNNLSDAELVDQHTLKIAGKSYDIDSTQIAVSLGDEFYAIKGIDFASSGTSVSLVSTSPVVVNNLDLSDISAIFVDSQSLSLNTVRTLFFIINGSRYNLSAVTIDASGNFTASDKNYTPNQITMVINSSFYKLINATPINSKFIFYCTASNVTTWALINNKYQDASDVQILMGANSYSLDNVLVVSRNVLRIGGHQYNISNGTIGCRINGTLYSIDEIDYDSTLNMVTMDTAESTGTWSDSLPSQPEKYIFYLNDSVYRDGTTSATTIYAGGNWRTFDSITISDQSHFVYSNTSYNLIGAQIKISGTQFVVVDSAWRVRSQVLEVYLQAT